MRNYDFHELLSPIDFEHFAASILKIRDGKKMKVNSITNDGGIDVYDLEEEIVVQAKNYQNNASEVISSLKKEVDRVRKINPKRYIVVTSVVMGKTKRETLLSMFEGYLHKEDILDRNDLNELLTDPKYHELEIEYLQLLVPNSFVLSHYLDSIENKKIYTKTEIELDKIKEDKKIFAVNENFFQSLDKLLKEKSIIISGEPGIGKSTLGRMLSAYLINQNPNTEFISINSLEELFQIYKQDKSQVYFFDDFWGDTKYDFRITDKEKEQIIDFIKYIQKAEDKWLIMTTREYILKDGIQTTKRLQDKYQFHKFTINIKEISIFSKFNILYNHIHNANLSWQHSNFLLSYWETIVSNANYNPRYITTFFEKYSQYKNLNNFEYLHQLMKYLNNPEDAWKEVLDKQPIEVVLFLIMIALNNDKMNIQEMNKKYNNILNTNKIETNTFIDFKELIQRMDNDFTITREKDNEIIIEFKNPSYKDFIYNYLKDNMVFYISYIYNENLSLVEQMNLWEILNKNFEIFKDLKETKKLDMEISSRIFNQSIKDASPNLIQLAEITEFNYHTKVEEHLINFMISGLQDIEDIMYNDGEHFQLLFSLLEVLGYKYDFSKYIPSLLDTIVFSDDELFVKEKLSTIKKLYPDVYNNFYKEYKNEIRRGLISSVRGDIYYYEEQKDLIGLENLKYEWVPTLYKDLGMKVPIKLESEIDEIIDKLVEEDTEKFKNINNYISSYKPKKERENQEDLSTIDYKIEELVGKNKYIIDPSKLLKKWKISLKIKNIISQIEKDDLLKSLVHYEETLYLLCQYLNENIYFKDSMELLNNFEEYLIRLNHFTEDETSEFYNLCQFLIIKNKIVFKKEELDDLETIYIENVDKIIQSSFFIKRGKWYHFIHPTIQIHLLLKLIKQLHMENIVKLETVVGCLIKCDESWIDLNFEDYDCVIIYRLIENMFPMKWKNLVKIPAYREFIEKINTKNEIEIAKSILKEFNLTIRYDYFGGGVVYRNDLLYNLLKIDFSIDIIHLFSFGATECDELNEFLNELIENGEELEINKNLRKQSFIHLLKESGIITILNELYQNLLMKLSCDLMKLESEDVDKEQDCTLV